MIDLIIPIIIIAFVMEFIDAFAGMGFGVVTPILILMGYSPLEVVFAVLLNSALLSIAAGISHHKFKNINFFHKTSFKITYTLILIGMFSILVGVFVAIRLPEHFLKMYIGVIFILVGIIILVNKEKKEKLSWKKLISTASFASLNKGITGGGFGPLLTAGQMMSGIDIKKAISTSSMTEGIISLAGVIFYLLFTELKYINAPLIVSLALGGIFATPLAAYAVNKMHPKGLRRTMAIVCMILGIITMLN